MTDGPPLPDDAGLGREGYSLSRYTAASIDSEAELQVTAGRYTESESCGALL